MKTKTIEKIISRKVNAWIASVSDAELQDRLRGNVIVTGGCIASMLLNEKVNDYDMYFTSWELAADVAQYYVTQINEAGIKVDRTISDRVSIFIPSSGMWKREAPTKEPHFAPEYVTSNAITLGGDVQLITRFFGSPREIHQNFDYVHAMNYWHDGELVTRKDALESLMAKELRYVGSLYPVTSLFRLRKFLKRGFTCHAGNIAKMAIQISDLDLHNPKVLADQLTGVDSLYFNLLLREIKANHSGEWVDSSYLMRLIEELMNKDLEPGEETEGECA